MPFGSGCLLTAETNEVPSIFSICPEYPAEDDRAHLNPPHSIKRFAAGPPDTKTKARGPQELLGPHENLSHTRPHHHPRPHNYSFSESPGQSGPSEWSHLNPAPRSPIAAQRRATWGRMKAEDCHGFTARPTLFFNDAFYLSLCALRPPADCAVSMTGQVQLTPTVSQAVHINQRAGRLWLSTARL